VGAEALNTRINLLLAGGEVEEALTAFDQLAMLQPNNASCDDGKACTTGDVCVAGHCTGNLLEPWINEIDYDGPGNDTSEFIELAASIPIRADIELHPLADGNIALQRVAEGTVHGAAVLVP